MLVRQEELVGLLRAEIAGPKLCPSWAHRGAVDRRWPWCPCGRAAPCRVISRGDWKRRIWKMRSSVAGEDTIKVLIINGCCKQQTDLEMLLRSRLLKNWLLCATSAPFIVIYGILDTSPLNIPSNHDKLIDLMETHRFEITSIWWKLIDMKSHRFDGNSSIWNHIDLKTNRYDYIRTTRFEAEAFRIF